MFPHLKWNVTTCRQDGSFWSITNISQDNRFRILTIIVGSLCFDVSRDRDLPMGYASKSSMGQRKRFWSIFSWRFSRAFAPIHWSVRYYWPCQQGHLAKYVVEVGDEDYEEGEAAKDVEEAGHISGTRWTHQIPAGKAKVEDVVTKLLTWYYLRR